MTSAAVSTRFPTIIVVREATVGPLLGTSDVSGSRTSICSQSSPSAAAEFSRRETNDGGPSIEMPLQSENTLRRAKAAKSSMWRSIGGHDATLNQNIGAGVRAGGVNRASGQYYGRKRFVRPAVECEINLHRQKFPLARDGRAVTRARRMPLRGRGHIFGAVVNHFHRLARFQREQSSVARDHRRAFFFAATAAAGPCLYHAHSFLGQAE